MGQGARHRTVYIWSRDHNHKYNSVQQLYQVAEAAVKTYTLGYLTNKESTKYIGLVMNYSAFGCRESSYYKSVIQVSIPILTTDFFLQSAACATILQ